MNVSMSSPVYQPQSVSYNTHASSQVTQASEPVVRPIEPTQPIEKPIDRHPKQDVVNDYTTKMNILFNDNELHYLIVPKF